MTKQNRKILLICIGVIIASFVIRNVVISAIQMARYRQAVLAAQQRKAQQAVAPGPVKPAEPQPAAPAPPPPFPYPGVWAGSAAVEGKGLCETRIEMRVIESQPDHFTGDWSMTCRPYRPLISKERAGLGAGMLNRLTPEAAIFSGIFKDGAMQFTVDKVVARDAEGCSPTYFAITPFGSAQLASEWQEGANCPPGGHMMLHKVRP
jgi:hypothetical protein